MMREEVQAEEVQARDAAQAAQVAHPRVVRTDLRTRDLVNQAVASVPTLGLQRAAEFLAAMNVPAEIAVRTLVYPQRRRRG
jgi:predicted membrane chloride channel (bestrophin family)